MVHIESFVVCIFGKMAHDVEMMLCFYSHLVWLVFEGSIPTYTCFHFCVTCSCCFFVLFFRREEMWEGRPRGRCMVCTV